MPLALKSCAARELGFALIWAWNFWGELALIAVPSAVSLSVTPGAFIVAAMRAFSTATIAGGVAAGTRMPTRLVHA